jgi:hypothetical protein
MTVSKDAKTRKKTKRKGKVLSPKQLQEKRRELVGKVADIVIEQHREALKELERH